MAIKKQTLKLINYADITPNDWNPNLMSEEMYTKVKNSILKQGFTEQLKVIPLAGNPGKYTIIDGEHRHRILNELMDEFQAGKMKYDTKEPETNILAHFFTSGEIPCVVMEGYTEAELRLETLNSNYMGGDPDPYKTGEVLSLIQKKMDNTEKLVAFSKDQVSDYLEVFKEPKDELIAAEQEMQVLEDERPVLYRFKIEDETYTFVITGKHNKEYVQQALDASKGIDDNYKFLNICKLFAEIMGKVSQNETEGEGTE